MAVTWKNLPAGANTTIRMGGFYTALVRDKLRVVALNSNVCYIFNWWMFYGTSIMKTQLQWFHDTLLMAEKNNEKVHVLNHMFNGHEDTHKPCSREYRRIMDRFYQTVVAEFHGHSEYWDFNIFYHHNNPKLPASVAFNGGSVASFIEVNRNYMVYSVDSATYVSIILLKFE